MDKLNIEVTCILPLVKGGAVSHGKVHDYGQWEFWGLVHSVNCVLAESGNEEQENQLGICF